MKQYDYIKIKAPEKGIATITLNRPEVHNAFNIEMIRELLLAYSEFNAHEKTKIILLKSEGKNFSAGADLKWMKDGINQSKEKLFLESRDLALLYKTIYESDKVTLALASGKIIGGAIGLIAASDIVVACPDTSFAFSEAKLGLIPATIAPYIIRKTGISIALEWFLTSRTISGDEAYNRGLVHWLVDKLEINAKCDELCNMLMRNGPEASKSIKDLLRNTDFEDHPNLFFEETADMIANKRISDEAQEGILAFLEKRNPKWVDEL